MTRYTIEGLVWWAGDNVYIEKMDEKDWNGLPTEVCLNDFIKNLVDENSKINITIDVEKPKTNVGE